MNLPVIELFSFSEPKKNTPELKKQNDAQAVQAALSRLRSKLDSAEPLEILRYPNHRPSCISPAGWDISWSHTSGLVAIIAGPGWVGIDAERQRPLNQDLWGLLGAGAENETWPAEILTIWTIKEAVLKLLGLGISGWLGEIQVTELTETGKWRILLSERIVKIVNFRELIPGSNILEGFTFVHEGFRISWVQVPRHACQPVTQRLTS